MDQALIQSLQKWPHVPSCFGWLYFGRRGEWRIQNEYAQQYQLLGETITHSGFKHYIESNLGRDSAGNHFFQNGPQRVFIQFAYSPWVVRFYPLADGHWQLRTTFGQPITPTACFLDEQSHISFEAEFEIPIFAENHTSSISKIRSIGLLHDHDLEIFSAFAKIYQNSCGSLGEFLWQGKMSIEPIHTKDMQRLFQYVKKPEA